LAAYVAMRAFADRGRVVAGQRGLSVIHRSDVVIVTAAAAVKILG